MRNTGYSTNGLTTISTTITTKAMDCARENPNISGGLSKEAAGPDKQQDPQKQEDHGGRGLRVEHLGQSFDDAQAEAGQDRSHDRPHAANDDHGEHGVDEVG